MTADEAAEFFDPANGLHANKGETSAVLAINPDWVDMDAANAEMPPFPEVAAGGCRGPHRFLLLGAGLGPPRDALGHLGRRPRVVNAEFGERYLDVVTADDDPPDRGHRAHLRRHAPR